MRSRVLPAAQTCATERRLRWVWLSAAVVLLGALMLLHWMGDDILGKLMGMMRFCLGGDGLAAMDSGQMVATIGGAFRVMATIVLPLMVLV